MVELSVCAPGDNYSAQQGSFEGPEKLLEIWFSPSPNRLHDHQNLSSSESSEAEDDHSTSSSMDDKELVERFSPPRSHRHGSTTIRHSGLRVVPRPVWDDVLSIVKCTVLNVIHNEDVDAYLLSESSMFVYPHKLILKTCGTTTLLLALPRLLEIAKQYCDFEKVWRVFYSRKAFMFPERQTGPHRSWQNEVDFLDKYFDNGSAYQIGKVAADHWYLYLTKPADDVLHHPKPRSHPYHLQGAMREREIMSGCSTPITSDTEDPSPFGNAGHSYPDQTVEILMTRLNPEKMKKFYHDATQIESGTVGGQWVDKETGIGRLYPEAHIDSFLFEPCGYSSNGLSHDRYFTIHVTPEPDCSYASFETNIPVEDSHAGDGEISPIEALVHQVVDIFGPETFTVTFFTSHHKEYHSHSHMVRSMSSMQGYQRTDRILYEFDGYDLVYGHYTKDDSA
ncbi:adenosylmethionine decarboxylase [Radiomyces spectabilis]|uniref:adenosylmethionine decarboxylase n=1 Tax=Radiomyces spectabilis TaxID=64574 RepID=UPI00222018B2|nr:adenosylmethionine decarboxylase [Radiomyces spectabilis]KAI8364745.1 adenosylmethionine decarboxylase [Radiomyces spectabilis]